MFGYYADGVDEATATLPAGWKDRRVLVIAHTLLDVQVRGWCLETHDLAIAKIVAGRPKDIEYCRALIRLGYISREKLAERLSITSMPEAKAKRAAATLEIVNRVFNMPSRLAEQDRELREAVAIVNAGPDIRLLELEKELDALPDIENEIGKENGMRSVKRPES